MLGAIAIVPSALVLVPELAGAAAAEVAGLQTAVFAAAASLPLWWVAIGVGDADAVVASPHVGTFAGFGADVRVRLSPDDTAEPAELPLCALFTAWVREQTQPETRAEVRVYRADLDAHAALAAGSQLRVEIEQAPEPIGLLVVADGETTLTPAAPGGYHPGDVGVQRALDDALSCGDVDALRRLPSRIVGRAAFQVLAGLAGAPPRSAKELYRTAPYGVGYFVGVWQP